MINNRYILGERLFEGARVGELFRARDTLAIQTGSRPQVLIHFISSAEMGYSEYRRIGDQLLQSKDITNSDPSLLGVLDSGWIGEKGYFVLESPEAWSVNILPPISASPTSLHRRADKLVRGFRKQQLVHAGLDPSFFLVASNGDLYLLGTALNAFVQKLQSNSGLLSGAASQHHAKTNTGVLKWLGWSLLAFGSASLAGGIYINRQHISTQFPLLFSDQPIASPATITERDSVPQSSGKPTSQQNTEMMITLADQQVSPVVSTQTAPAKVELAKAEPEKTVIQTLVEETGLLVDENNSAIIPSAAEPEPVAAIPVPEPEVRQIASPASKPDFEPLALAVEPDPFESNDVQPDLVNPELSVTDNEPEVDVIAPSNTQAEILELPGIVADESEVAVAAPSNTQAETPELPRIVADEPEVAVTVSKNLDSKPNEVFTQLAHLPGKFAGTRSEDFPTDSDEKAGSKSAPIQLPIVSQQAEPEELKPARAPVSWNGMSEQEVLHRAEKALKDGRLQIALYYLRALWRKGVKDGKLLTMVEKVAADQQGKAKISLVEGEVSNAKIALKQAARLIGEFDLTGLTEAQIRLEGDLATR